MKKLAQAKTKILRGAFLAFLIMSMSAMPTVQAADVNIYQDGRTLPVEPETVGASSSLDLYIDTVLPAGAITELVPGGCVFLEFAPITDYGFFKDRGGDVYEVFPGVAGAKLDCTGLTPAKTDCELVSNTKIKLTLGTAGTAIRGALPGMRNPFS
jgi:hypothetical protein